MASETGACFWVAGITWLQLSGLARRPYCRFITAISTVVIPQSMAYAMLAPLPPVYGLYTSVVPILIYCIFGTSRHMHTGTFAITTLLLGQAVRGLMASENQPSSPTFDPGLAHYLLYDSSTVFSSALHSPTPGGDDYQQRFIGMILLLSLVVGCVQIILSFLRVGGWASKNLLPDALVGGFNTAAVFHIGTSQLKHFLGLKNVPSPQGAFALLKSWKWIGTHILDTNWYTVALGFVAIAFMLVLRKAERYRKSKHDLERRKKEFQQVQQRQAVSVAILKRGEEERERQLNNQRSNQGSSRPTASTFSNDNSGTQTSVAPSNLSLSTVAETETTVSPSLDSGSSRDVECDVVSNHPTAEDRQVYIPIPDILLAVIVLTVINVLFTLDKPKSDGGMGIDVIGTIPKGLPKAVFAPTLILPGGAKEWATLDFLVRYILPMIQPALLIAVIIYVMSFSIAKQFGKQYGYKVDADQEMFALGLASVGGSCFSAYACTGSLTRTAILSQSGGKTPLASVVGVVVVILTLICLTWCFERVPNCVLAAIVLVALQSLVMQITEPLKLWRIGHRKACIIWTATFLAVLLISVEIGIAVGMIVVLISTFYSHIANRHHARDLDPLLSHRHGSVPTVHTREGTAAESS
ncbi:hypothetical protein BGZ94_000149 [Podila epigama]|nr:hypothetical protein BGZ94_000149 [Podila epigama]